MEFTMFRFSMRNRKKLLKTRQGETWIILECVDVPLRQIIFNPYGFMFRYNLFDKFVSKKVIIKLFRLILILNGNSNNISMILWNKFNILVLCILIILLLL